MYGKTLAIFGLGRIGGLVAERARAFGMRLIGCDPYCSPDRAEQLGVKLYDTTEEAIAEADFITVHLPKTATTIGMFGPEQFAAMKDGVVLVNTARGGIYDVDSLADFVAAGKMFAVGLDVYEEEPCTSSPLHELDAAVLTPHIAALYARGAGARGYADRGSMSGRAWRDPSFRPRSTYRRCRPRCSTCSDRSSPACKMMGRVAAQVLGGIPTEVSVEFAGAIAGSDPAMLVAATLDGAFRTAASTPSPRQTSIRSRRAMASRSNHRPSRCARIRFDGR